MKSGHSTACRISRIITMNHTAIAKTKAPATIHPVETIVPSRKTTANEMMPIQARQAIAKKTNTFEGLNEEIKIR